MERQANLEKVRDDIEHAKNAPQQLLLLPPPPPPLEQGEVLQITDGAHEATPMASELKHRAIKHRLRVSEALNLLHGLNRDQLKQLYTKTSGVPDKRATKDSLIEALLEDQGLVRYLYKSRLSGQTIGQIVEGFQGGSGLVDGRPGLFNSDIARLMRRFKKKGFAGVYPIDRLGEIKVTKGAPLSFILNTVPHDVEQGHFVAVMVDLNRETLEYYDPFGAKPIRGFAAAIRPVLAAIGMPHPQYKVNRLRNQSWSSANCGYFAMHFLLRRYHGATFREASGYDQAISVMKSEEAIRRFKRRLIRFKHL